MPQSLAKSSGPQHGWGSAGNLRSRRILACGFISDAYVMASWTR
jgi:hypothetical protein